MDFQEIDIFISPDGKVQLKVRGVKGEACLDLTKDLEAALGGQIESREMTADAYEQAQDQIQDRLQQKNK
jgi:hypothetical protein